MASIRGEPVVIARRRSRRSSLLAAAALLMVACAPEEQAAEAPEDPVVVYADYEDRTYLTSLFSAYTKDNGSIVIVRHGDADAIVDDVIENKISPPADLLLTRSVRGVYRAAEEGALRPIPAAIIEKIPPALQDPDRLWAALTYSSTLLVYDPEVISAENISSVELLAEPQLRGQLCLSSSSINSNLNVIARLIDTHGVRNAELMVRGWVANLARPPFDTESKLLRAIDAGGCSAGMISSQSEDSVSTDLATHDPAPSWVDIEGIGIARHARNPDGAARLIEWLTSEAVQQQHAAATFSQPSTGEYDGEKHVSLIAWHFDDAVKLAERARFR